MSDLERQDVPEEVFRDIVDSLDAVWVMAAERDERGAIVDFRYEYVNPAGLEMLGEKESDVVGHRLLEFYPSTFDLGVFDAYCRVVETGEPVVDELPWFEERQVKGYFEVRVQRFGDGYLGWARDITDRKRAERKLAQSETLLRAVLDSSPDGTIRYDADLRIDYVNERVLKLTGTTLDDWIGKTNADLGHPEANVRRVLETGEPGLYEFEADNIEGHRIYEAILAPQRGEDGSVEHVLAISRDITDRELAKEYLTEVATHDSLTGLANRASVVDETRRALETGRRSGHRTGLLMIDLDHFKNVNDSLGHAIGDELLVAAARRLEHTVRAGDLLARQGGDEFVVVMRDLDDGAEAMRVAERIVTAFRRPLIAAGLELTTTASVGATVAEPGEDVDAGDLLREADTAMYLAKGDGRDRAAQFNAALRRTVTDRRRMEEDLRHALPRHELAVWYQPEIDLNDGSIRAVEALLRWHHPSGEVYPAARFIEIAEETGLILDVGDWVIGQVGRHAGRWADARPERLLIARVNLSALQLAEKGLLDAIDAAIDLGGLTPGQLSIEVSENSLLQGTTAVRDNVAAIRERGIAVAVDDFGTGYASLTSLNEYPVDVVKLDRSVVSNLTVDKDKQRLVASIVAVASRLGIEVTAAGVERPDQAHLLHDLGCVAAQGFLYFGAVPPERIDRLLGIEETVV